MQAAGNIPVAAAKPIELKTKTGNASVFSNLAPNDAPFQTKKISKSFLMPMESGRTYELNYRSQAFDCYLYLEDPDGRLVAEDDDGGGGLDSRIIHKAAKSGLYRIIATSLDGKSTGQFSLSIAATGVAAAKLPPIEAPDLPKPVQPAPIIRMGEKLALFNGKDTTGWRAEGKDGWKVEQGGELVGEGPNTVLLTNRKDFKNFSARIELSASADTDAFLAFRENPGPNAAIKLKGLTTRLIGDGASVSAGNAGLNGTKFEAGQKRVKVKAGESIALEIDVSDDTLRIFTNGQATAAMPIPQGYAPGAIGLHIVKGTVRIKKIEVTEEQIVAAKEAPVEPLPIAKGEFVPLFNGKDLDGWQPHAKRKGNWRVENGILIGSAPIGGALYTTRGDFEDFHLRAEARINDKGFGRLLVRTAYDPTKIPFKTLGYEALINQRPVGAKTGTLTATSAIDAITIQAKDAPAPPGEWFLLEIIGKGDLITVKVNGTVVAESFDDRRRKFALKGHIVLQQDANAVLEFRKVEIMDPAAVKVVAAPRGPRSAAAQEARTRRLLGSLQSGRRRQMAY